MSYTNTDNWDVGRVPCAQDKVIFTDEVGWTKAVLVIQEAQSQTLHFGHFVPVNLHKPNLHPEPVQ